MKTVGVVLAGLGRVGESFFRLVEELAPDVRRRYGLEVRVLAALKSDGAFSSGSPLCLTDVFRDGVPRTSDSPAWRPGLPPESLFRSLGPGCLVECAPSDLKSGEPGLSLISAALSNGWHVATASKGALVVAYRGLTDLASGLNLRLKFSGATAAALPALDIGTGSLAGMKITAIEGILNGTTNFILTKMAEGRTYEEGLKEAQDMGIAEADPSHDVEGWDTASKILLLANACLGCDFRLDDIRTEGITGITAGDVREAAKRGEVLKLLGACAKASGGEGWDVAVRLVSLPPSHPLHHISGTEKGITFTTVEMGTVTVTGGRSNPRGAAAALLKDVINIYR
jgi:homoserine dehydrogenase